MDSTRSGRFIPGYHLASHDTHRATIFCRTCDDIFDVRVTERQAIGHDATYCPGCDLDTTEFYQRWDSGQAMGCAIERAFGDGNDIGG